MDKRGPKIGDAASLWNFTPSPGWTKEESLILKLCLMKYGVGHWIQIQSTGLLPGKMIQQLNGATQRLLGQQSLAAFSGLHVDIDRVRADNEAKVDAHRKNGLVIWTGPNPTKEMKFQWQQEAKEKYGLTAEQLQEAETALEELAGLQAATAPQVQEAATTAAEALPPGINILECDAEQLSIQQQQLLLCALHQRLQQLVAKAVQQHPSLTHLVTYQQQRQHQQQTSWIAQGLPCIAAAGVAAAVAAGSSVGVESDASDHKENRPNLANVMVRPAAGAAAGRLSKGSSSSSRGGSKAGSRGSSRGGRGGSKPAAGKKRGRSKAAAAADADCADDEDTYLQQQQQQQQRKRGPGRAAKGAGGSSSSGMMAEMMQVALEAGVTQLMEMGYSRSKAVDALKECHCDVELAVEYLATACC